MSAGGDAIIGQDSGEPAVVTVDGQKWVFLSQNANTAGSLTVKKTGTLSAACIACEHPVGSSLVLDGGTLVRNADNPSSHDFIKDFYKNGADTPITLTANGGTIQANVETLITPRIVCADGVSSAVLTKTGSSDVTLSGEIGAGVGVKVAGGNLKLRDGLVLDSLEVAQGAKFIVDISDEAIVGTGEYSPVKEGGTFTMPDGASLSDYVGYVAPAGLAVTLELKDGRPVLTATVSDPEAKIGETEYASLANAAVAATAGQTVELVKNCSLFDPVAFKASDVALNLAGHTITRVESDGCINFEQGGVVSNGTFTTVLGRESRGESLLAMGDGKSLLVADVTIGSEGSELYNVFYARKKSTITIRNVSCYATTLFSCYYQNNDVGIFDVESGDFHFRAWKTRSNGYKNGKVQLSGGSYTLKPSSYDVKDGYRILHTPANTDLPYSVVPYDESLVQVGGLCYSNQAEAESAYVAYVKETGHYFTTISDAVAEAPDGGTIDVIADVLDFPEMVQVTGERTLTINGNGHLVRVAKPFVDESGYVGVDYVLEFDALFTVWGNCDLTIRDLHIMGGGKLNPEGDNTASNFAILNYGDLMLDNVTITRSNGAVFNGDTGHLYMNNCRLVRNCRYCAGGLFNYGIAVLNRTSLSENRSLSGGGGGGATENGHFMYLNNCVLCNNSSTEIGGAINNFHSAQEVRLYMMNTTISGNFGASSAYDYGGGIGLRAANNPGSLYGVNSIVLNNHHVQIVGNNETLRDSDIAALKNDLPGNDYMTNSLHYCVYGSLYMDGTQGVHWDVAFDTDGGDNRYQSATDKLVFNDYYASTRVYQNAYVTQNVIDGAELVSKDDGSLNADLARYAPIKKDGPAIFGTDGEEGVLTYFDASGWKTGDIKMSYKTLNGQMTPLGDLQSAAEAYVVTNFYERAYGRTIGIAGASGLLESEIEYHTVRLSQEPVNGTATGITLYGDSYPDGTEVTVVAQPDFACSFLGWYAADGTTLISSSAVYTFLVHNDVAIFPKFSEPAATVSYVVTARQGDEDADFPITVSTTWLNQYVDSSQVEYSDQAAVKADLNTVDPANGFKKWHEYVLGITPGDSGAKIWINSPQLWDATMSTFCLSQKNCTV